MKNQTDFSQLLDDVLGESFPSDFQAELLGQTLRQARRRRRVRHASRCLLAAILIVATSLALWRKPPRPVETAQLPTRGFGVVYSQPLAPSMIIESQSAPVIWINSSKDSVTVIETGAVRDPFREIDDEQLLALAGGRPAALVRHDSHHAEFLLLNPDDRRGFAVP